MNLSSARMRGSAWISLLLLVVLVGGGLAVWFGLRDDESGARNPHPLTPPLARGPLRLKVIANGSLEALKAHIVTNRVEGRTTIISIVPEGTVVTPEDVANKKVLVRLDTSNIDERLAQQDIGFKNARAALVNAQSNLDIQRHQNESDIRGGELDLRFARLDLERYIGSRLTSSLYQTGLEPPTSPKAGGSIVQRVADLLDDEALSGEALQRIRSLDAEITLADEELRRAQDKLKNSEKLHAKGYISGDELDADKLALQRRTIEAEKARTARSQFATYDFSKEVQQLLSDVREAESELDRIRAKAKAAEARATADVTSRREQAALQEGRLAKLRAQRELCVIRAEVPGLIVFGSTGRRHWRDDNDQIREGTQVRERQELLRIPETGRVGVKVSLHESVIQQVRVGMPALISVDGVPGERIAGRVKTMARMPSQADRWLNPDLKVYDTLVALDGEHPGMKPGMSATVEIIVAELDDVLAVPVQAVAGTSAAPEVYVADGTDIVARPVTLGPSSEQVIVITSGLAEGDRVVLDPPMPKDEDKQADGAPDGPPREAYPGSTPRGTSKGTTGGKGRSGKGKKGRKKRGSQ